MESVAERIGTEIENVEALFTDSGMYIFKVYTNGHSYDTAVVWVCLFKALIESNYIPAIIVPKGFPNISTYDLLRQFIEPEIAGSLITYKDIMFEEEDVCSYYDFKPTKINPGDIVINEKNFQQIILPQIKGSLSFHFPI